jgi:hypothetical protein
MRVGAQIEAAAVAQFFINRNIHSKCISRSAVH